MWKSVIDESVFRARLIERFPDLQGEIGDRFAEGFVHVQLGLLKAKANACIERGDFSCLRGIYWFLEELIEDPRDFHPNVLNGIYVSFLEGLDFGHHPFGASARKLLPANMSRMLEELGSWKWISRLY